MEVGALLGRLETGEGAAADAAASEPQPPRQTDAARETVPARATAARATARVPPPSPAVRRLLEEHGLDPTQIEGTGKGGRLLKSDVLAAVVARAAPAAAPARSLPSEPEPRPAAPTTAPSAVARARRGAAAGTAPRDPSNARMKNGCP